METSIMASQVRLVPVPLLAKALGDHRVCWAGWIPPMNDSKWGYLRDKTKWDREYPISLKLFRICFRPGSIHLGILYEWVGYSPPELGHTAHCTGNKHVHVSMSSHCLRSAMLRCDVEILLHSVWGAWWEKTHLPTIYETRVAGLLLELLELVAKPGQFEAVWLAGGRWHHSKVPGMACRSFETPWTILRISKP